MDYTAHSWARGETISAERLNAIEQQLEALTKAVQELQAKRTRRSAKKAQAGEQQEG